MQVFVISLPDSGERRRSIERQFNREGIRFEFFNAIRGDVAIRDCIFKGFNEADFWANTGRHAVIGEIGCFASHRKLWNHCVKLNRPIVIMEDDCNILPGFDDAIRIVADIIDKAGIIYLQNMARKKRLAVRSLGKFQIERFVRPPNGTMCYSISPQVARRFLNATRIIDAPVDVFMTKYWQHRQPTYALIPFTVAPSVLSVESTIGVRKVVNNTLKARFSRFCRNMRWFVQRCIFNWQVRTASSPLVSSRRRQGIISPRIERSQ